MSIVSPTVTPARPWQFSRLKSSVARVIGGETDQKVLAAAGDYINEAIIDLNQEMFECNKLKTDTLTVTNGSATLPSAFYKEIEFSLVSSTGVKIRQLNYLDYAEFKHTYAYPGSEEASGSQPTGYTLFNTHVTGILTLLGAGTPSTNYVSGSYYKRFDLLEGDEEVLDAPQEVQRAILTKARLELLMAYAPQSPSIPMQGDLAAKAWNRLMATQSKHPDHKFRFRLPPLAARPNAFNPGVEYIKVS